MKPPAFDSLPSWDRAKICRATQIAFRGDQAAVILTEEMLWQVYDLGNKLGKARFEALMERHPEYLVGIYQGGDTELRAMVIADLWEMGAI
jgi:hypothetical protein